MQTRSRGAALPRAFGETSEPEPAGTVREEPPPAGEPAAEPEAPDDQKVTGKDASFTRDDVYTRPMSAGRAVADNPLSQALAWLREALKTKAEKHEDHIDAQLQALPGVSRSTTVGVVSPKGGVGKTTTSFLLGNLFAEVLRLRVVTVDANPDFGTLAALAPDDVRAKKSQIDLLIEGKKVTSPADLHSYVSRLPTGLHLLGAPPHAELMAQMTPERYEELLGILRRFYEVIILDLGTGITDPIAQFATKQADHVAVVATPEWITSANVLGALRYLDLDAATLVLNQALPRRGADNREVIEANFRRQAISDRVSIPHDPQLRTMLDSGTYELGRLKRPTRVPIKELGLMVGRDLP